MLRYYFVIQYVIIFISSSNAQTICYPNPKDSSIITIKEFFNGYGKVFKGHDDANRDAFGNQYTKPFIDSYIEDFELSHEAIIQAELLLFEHYNNVFLKDDRFRGYDFSVRNPQRHLRHHYRQYIGFIDNNDHQIVLIHLMNFRNKRKAEKYFLLWYQSFNIGTGNFYENNQLTFLINLSNNKVNVY